MSGMGGMGGMPGMSGMGGMSGMSGMGGMSGMSGMGGMGGILFNGNYLMGSTLGASYVGKETQVFIVLFRICHIRIGTRESRQCAQV